MARGAGFSISAIKSGKDNRNLGKIRPKLAAPDGLSRDKNMELTDLKSLDEGVRFRMSRRNSLVKSGYFFVAITTLFILWILYILFF
ncbi:hypothetical protein PBT90_11975 [Algoriphagus halophytocola]|uniref:Riboflavin synthase subunit beta n=1 Tax=Algoriphagus halophytocola TaxID=2991499 RepID=A0ABY6MLQ3_9BACT|nr:MULTISPECIES: hypothetical protein [unclassified Algoriphagus]UZD24103.1 hypothetical protein OM944_06285 [Algoriphagus sp. TR-M5]WBL41474.1 hypothetical protein PBT90_11975 [Algoriphagus sp. TR-M9]